MAQAKAGSKEAQMREQREADAGPARVGRNAIGEVVLPRKGVFYMGNSSVFPSLSGMAHKIKDSFKTQKVRYDAHPACEPTEFPTDGPFKGGISINLPYSTDEPAPQPAPADAPRCQLCVEGRQAWPETKAQAKGGSRQQRAAATPKAPVVFTFPTFKPEDPMFAVTAFYKTWHGHVTDGVGADRAQDLIPDDVRSRALEALLKSLDAPADVYDIIFEKAKPSRIRKATAKAKADEPVVVETPVETVIETVEPPVLTLVEPVAETDLNETPASVEANEALAEVKLDEPEPVAETPAVEPEPTVTEPEVAPEPEPEPTVEEGIEPTPGALGLLPTRTDEPQRADFESLADYSAAVRAFRNEADQPSA